MACIWNKELLREFAVEMGKAMLDINVDVWLAPSINLHRNPLGGRGNEYYSEDPILSGLVASVVAEGVAESGVTVCLKHFAGNDQEYYRRGVINDTTEQNGTSRDAINVIATERTLREIYLKAFEMAVKTGKVMNVMSAFNKINGQYCASNEGLLTDILRGEWGFQGFVVTDWGDYDVLAHEGHALAAGNDLNMPGGHSRYWITNKYRESLADGSLTLDQMRRSAYRLLNTIQSSALSSMPEKHNFASNLSIQSTTLPDAKIGFEYSESKVNPLIAAGGKGSRYPRLLRIPRRNCQRASRCGRTER
ncbi:MAG: glycoside hydrolase family 3 protein [Anaeromassilibacillus sp.]